MRLYPLAGCRRRPAGEGPGEAAGAEGFSESRYDSVMMDYVLSKDGQGNAQMLTRRNRLVKRSSGFRWVNPVHEVLVVSGNVMHVPIEILTCPIAS